MFIYIYNIDGKEYKFKDENDKEAEDYINCILRDMYDYDICNMVDEDFNNRPELIVELISKIKIY